MLDDPLQAQNVQLQPGKAWYFGYGSIPDYIGHEAGGHAAREQLGGWRDTIIVMANLSTPGQLALSSVFSCAVMLFSAISCGITCNNSCMFSS